MKKQIKFLSDLTIHARDYVKRADIAPVNNYVDFGGGLRAYCTNGYDFFVMYYDLDTRLTVHNLRGTDNASISFNTDLTDKDLQTMYDKTFAILFEYEKNQADVLEKQRIAQIAELESKLARLRDL